MKITLGGIALFPLAISFAAAQAADQDAVIVTATRTAETADETLAPVTVITREDIERSQAKSLPELLTGSPGVDFTVQGGYGKLTNLYLRGTNPGHVLVLVDGIKLGSATAGTTALEQIPLSQIERIELVRGPRSSLYGSEAIGGVIQIFTRRGGDQWQVHADVGAGTYATRELSAGFSGARGTTRFSLNAGRFDTDGFDARKPTTGPFGVDEPDDDGYDNTSFSANLRHSFTNGAELALFALRTEGKTYFDGFPNSAELLQQTLGGSLSLAPLPNWALSLRIGQGRDESDNYFDGTYFSTFDTERRSASWQNDLALGEHQLLTLGLDYLDDRVDSSVAYTESSRNNLGLFVQDQLTLGAHDLQAALRHDDNEAFGGQTTGSLTWGYGLMDTLRLTASFGTAFKAPTFNDLYWPDDGFFAGNPDLKPEESQTLELGLQGRPHWGRWETRLYRTEVDELIVYVYDPATFHGTMENVNKAQIDGFEGEVKTTVAGWQVGGSVTLLDPRDKDTDKVLTRRSRETLRLDLDRDFGRFSTGLTVLFQGSRYEDPQNTLKLDSYNLVTLRGEYRLTKDWRLQGSIKNLFDEDYETVTTYNSPGREFFLALAYRPQ